MNKGKDNLKPNAQRAPGELKAMGAKGGAASGAARRRLLFMRELRYIAFALQAILRSWRKVSPGGTSPTA